MRGAENFAREMEGAGAAEADDPDGPFARRRRDGGNGRGRKRFAVIEGRPRIRAGAGDARAARHGRLNRPAR